jgi:hypothetical protein
MGKFILVILEVKPLAINFFNTKIDFDSYKLKTVIKEDGKPMAFCFIYLKSKRSKSSYHWINLYKEHIASVHVHIIAKAEHSAIVYLHIEKVR